MVLSLLFSISATAGNGDLLAPPVEGRVYIAAGEFVMGSDKIDTQNTGTSYGNVKPWYVDEHPQHKAYLPAYYLDRYEVSNVAYAHFTEGTGADMPPYWMQNGYLLSMARDKITSLKVEKLRALASKVYHLDMDTRELSSEALVKAINQHLDAMDKLPVQYVSWTEAEHYCQWAGGHLPSEAEWEKAARGPTGQEFPWGNEWRAGTSNAGSEQWDEGVAPVGSYPNDKSPYGIFDMGGNVAEWVSDWYQAYPGSDYHGEAFGKTFRVVKGAGFGGAGHYALQLFQRAAYRGNFPPDGSYADVGFRCAGTAS